MENYLLKIRLMKSPIRQTPPFFLLKFPIKNKKRTHLQIKSGSQHLFKSYCLYLLHPVRHKGSSYQVGLTLIELMIVIAIIATLAMIAHPSYSAYVNRMKVTTAIQEIRTIQNEILAYTVDKGILPTDLSDINMDSLLDPWGNPYQYTNFDIAPKGKWRKDKFLVPINSTFDLWSMGPDGRSVPPLSAKWSQDDIVRANDGNFIGSAKLY